jgi:3-deoxy-alpha-D-manno-octulosonate 8-oxidase
MRGMEEFYPEAYKEFWSFVKSQKVKIPKNVCKDLKKEDYDHLYDATIIHEKPLTNALGEDFKEILTKQKVIEIFKMM